MTNAEHARQYLGLNWNDINKLQGRNRQEAMAVWQWASLRYSSIATEQNRYFIRYGAAKTIARVNRVRAWLGLSPV